MIAYATVDSTVRAKELRVFVAATTQCFPDRSLDAAIEKLSDLEFSHIEIGIHESGQHLKPSEVVADLARAYDIINSTRRLTVVGLSLEIAEQGEEYFPTFTKCCELAKLSKIVTSVSYTHLTLPTKA